MDRWPNTLLCAALVGLLGLLGWCEPVAAARPLNVMVMIAPQRYFVEQIGGNRVAVTVLVPPGTDPHTYEPKPQTMVQAAQAQLYLAMGIPEERAWLPRLLAIRSNLPVIHQDQGIAKNAMASHDHDEADQHSSASQPRMPAAPTVGTTGPGLPDSLEHGAEAAHVHDPGGLDPHIWLSPKLVRQQAETIASGLCAADPEGTAEYQSRLAAFQQKIDQLDRDLQTLFASVPGPKSFLVVHPSWGYFARDYGLTQMPMEVEGKEPNARDLARLIQRTTDERIPVLLVEPQFSQRLAEVVARQTGVRILVADPLAADWETNLRQVAEQLVEAFRAGRSQPEYSSTK
jgi:zinc transport system substrate-binding protein